LIATGTINAFNIKVQKLHSLNLIEQVKKKFMHAAVYYRLTRSLIKKNYLNTMVIILSSVPPFTRTLNKRHS
jgi:hypothetical protein